MAPERRRKRRQRRLRRRVKVGIVLVVVVLAAAGTGAGLQLQRSVPRQTVDVAHVAAYRVPGHSTLPWPPTGEAAVTVVGVTPVQAQGPDTPVPIASLAKMMTALLIIHDHPLSGFNEGPDLTIGPADVAAYNADVALQGSVVLVKLGEVLTERQALEALLLPSADNIATLLADWDAGSVAAFVQKMNAATSAMHLLHTTYTDPSGLLPTTVSTAKDQLAVALALMSVPVLASIVAMPSVNLPVAGVVANFNHDAGRFGVVGVKTGSDSWAQGCWAFAAARTVAGKPQAVIGVVLGIHGTSQGLIVPALAAGVALADAVPQTVRRVTVLRAGAVVGYIRAPWRGEIPIRTARAITGLVQAGQRISFHVTLRGPSGNSVRSGASFGSVSATQIVGTTSTLAVAATSGGGPTLWWRLTRR